MRNSCAFAGPWLACLAALAAVGCSSGRGLESTVRTVEPCLAGHYHGTATEIAVALELDGEGRFGYVLIYGALDERALGRWRSDGDQVLLTSDPVTPPAFALLGDEPATGEAWIVALDLPAGLSRQFFDAEFTFTDGTAETYQFSEEGLTLAFKDTAKPAGVRLLLPLYDLAGEIHPLSSEAPRALHFRFDANDIGKVAFDGKALEIAENALLFERHGRSLKLWRMEEPCQAP